ncbi:hypothetical protein TNCV_3915491 [Trichonephila clavipes]|nr:hypothetical protein TNCV_3915491 [Trichonephila clavipes]
MFVATPGHARLASHPHSALDRPINVGTVTDAFKDATASFLQSLLNHSCLKRIKARVALNTFHSSWTRCLPRAPFYHCGARDAAR